MQMSRPAHAIEATLRSTLLDQRRRNNGARRCLSATSEELLRRSYLYGMIRYPSFLPRPLLTEFIYAPDRQSPRLRTGCFGNPWKRGRT